MSTPLGRIRAERKTGLEPLVDGSRELGVTLRETLAWDEETGEYATKAMRHADVYVFALLAHQDKKTVNPLDLAQWRFYVVATTQLNERTRSQHSITLKSLDALAGPALTFADLTPAVEAAASQGLG